MLTTIACMLAGLQVLWCLICLCRRDLPPQPGEMKRFPWGRGFVTVGMVLEVAMAVFAVGFAIAGAGGVALVFAVFQLLATAIVTEACLHILVLTKNGFVIRTHFGRVHTCAWDEALYCSGDPKEAGGATSLQTRDKRFCLSFAPHVNLALLGMIDAERQKRGLGPLPQRRASLDPFDGHVREWQGVLAVYALLFAVLLAATGFVLAALFTPVSPENTQRMTFSFSSWSETGQECLNLVGQEDGMTYRASCNAAGMEVVRKACGTGAQYEAYTRLARPDDEPDYYRIFALTGADGTPYMTFEQSNAEERTEGLKILAYMGLGLAVMTFMFVRTIQVGRHPERYSQRTINRYFKRGYVGAAAPKRSSGGSA